MPCDKIVREKYVHGKGQGEERFTNFSAIQDVNSGRLGEADHA